MTSYFCTIKKGNWEKIKTTSNYFLNLHWENKMKNLVKGDKLIFYFMEEYNLIALYEVIGEAKEKGGEIFIGIKPITILKKAIDFREFIHNLELIKNPKRWGTYIQIPLRKLSKKDENVLLKAII